MTQPARRQPFALSVLLGAILLSGQAMASVTDEDILQIATLAREVIKAGRAATGRNDIRCTVSIGGFVPKPHTPFQWAAQLDHESTDARLFKLRDAIRADYVLTESGGLHSGEQIGIVERALYGILAVTTFIGVAAAWIVFRSRDQHSEFESEAAPLHP